MVKGGSDRCKLTLKTTKEEQVTVSLGAVKEINTDVAAATLSSESDGVFAL